MYCKPMVERKKKDRRNKDCTAVMDTLMSYNDKHVVCTSTKNMLSFCLNRSVRISELTEYQSHLIFVESHLVPRTRSERKGIYGRP